MALEKGYFAALECGKFRDAQLMSTASHHRLRNLFSWQCLQAQERLCKTLPHELLSGLSFMNCFRFLMVARRPSTGGLSLQLEGKGKPKKHANTWFQHLMHRETLYELIHQAALVCASWIL